MKRNRQLDGVRGLAIVMVVLWHYVRCQVDADPHTVAWYGSNALRLAWSGVDLFFVLSGFLIAGILIDNRGASNYFRIFYLRRVCRIMPLYFLLLGLYWLAVRSLTSIPSHDWLFANAMPMWSYATFTQNILMGLHGDYGAHWLGATWSLAVEEQFYLFVPLLVYAFSRRKLIGVLLAAVFAAPLLRIAFPGFHAFVNTPFRSDSLLSGACLAALVRWPPFVAAVDRHRRLILTLFVGLLAGAAVMMIRPDAFGAWKHFWLAGLYCTFILIALYGIEPRLHWLLGSAVLVWFGELSYGIYMFHEAVSGVAHGLAGHSTPQMNTLWDIGVTASAFCVTLTLAAVSFHFLESPILRFGQRFRYAAELQREIEATTAPSEAFGPSIASPSLAD